MNMNMVSTHSIHSYILTYMPGNGKGDSLYCRRSYAGGCRRAEEPAVRGLCFGFPLSLCVIQVLTVL